MPATLINDDPPRTRIQELREGVKHENEMINNRLTWMGTYQGLLLTALAFAWKDPNASPLVLVFSCLGVGVALSIGIGTTRANRAIEILESEMRAFDDPVGIRNRSGSWWLMPGYFLPWLFLSGWIAIAGVRLLAS